MTGDEDRLQKVLEYLEAVDVTHAIRLAHHELGPAIPRRPEGPDRRRPLPRRRGAVQEPAAATVGSDEPVALPAGLSGEMLTLSEVPNLDEKASGDARRQSLVDQLDELVDGYINFDLTEIERCDAALARDLLRLDGTRLHPDGAESVWGRAVLLGDWPAAGEFIARVLQRHAITPD